MSKYDAKQAVHDMDLLETRLLQKAEILLESSNSFEVAKIYSLVRKEACKIDEDARILKLSSQFDPEMHDVMSEGYRDIGIRLIRVSHEYSLGNKVLEIHNMIRFSSEINGTYLEEYLRKEWDKKIEES